VTNGTAGSTLRTTVTNYWAFQNSTALSYNMLDRPSSIAVTDGNTGQTTTTTYGYDENSLVSGNASTGWDSNPPNGNTRGNQTSVNRYWDTNNITLTTSKTYTDTGLLSSISEPNNPSISPAAKTSYDYSSSYDGGFVTKITDALGHASQYEYDLDSSNLTGATDVNNQKTSYSYNDPMLRLTGISHPGGDHNLATSIGYSYPDANTVVRTEVLNTSPQQIIQTDTTRYDGLGRETQAQHSDAEGDVYVDTTYDGLGRKYTETTPYRSTSDTQFYGKTTYSYDAFGRITQIQHPDQTTATFQYVGATTLTTNESNGSTQTQKLTKVDGLGRLIDVCEVTSKNPPVTSDTPSACGLEISETGFLTTYTQTLRGITKIQQGAQTRSFSYDSLSQLTDSTNPETGHIHYVYDNDGNVTSKTIPAPNDPPGSTNTLTIGYKYNSLHQLTQKTYSGSGPSATTPASTYNYSEASVDGKDLANPINRLTSEFTTLNGMVQAKSVYSYDTDGRIASHFQCVTNCGSYQDVEYHYDGQGNVASFSTPQLGYTNTYNDAGHLITITPNWTADANHPATLANIHYAPNGGWSSANFGSGVAETYSYSPRWLNSMQVSGLEVTTPPANATATITVTGSEASKQVQSSAPTAATGTVAVSGSERVNSNAVAASGTIVVNGSEQSKQVQSQGPTSSSGSVTVQGSEWTHKMCPEPNHCSTQWDTGAVYLTVNGYQVTAYFGQGSTTSSVASALSTALNVAGSPVSASASGAAVTFTSRATGSSTNYAVSASWTTNANDSEDTYTHSTDFTISPTSLAMSGGQDAQYRTVYDSGTLTVSVNGYSKSTSFGQGSTSASVASALAPQFSCTGGAPASGSPSGSNIVFTACTAGAAANSYAVASSASFDSGDFSSSSFTTSGTQLSGGKDQVWDQGTVTLTLPSGFVASASYGQNDTASSVAGKLYTALSSSSSPVTATNPGSGTAITLTTKATGASANGNIQIAVSGNYSGASDFSASSGGLTGGKNAGMTTVYDLGAVKLTVGGQSVSVNYGQTSTPSTLAQLLVSAVNSSSLPVTAQQNSASIILKAKQSGAAANGTAVSLNATTSDPTDFSSASFGGSPASTSLANGVTAVYTTETIYSFSLQHNPDTQIKQSADSANGTWNYTYDDFNRLISANEVNGSGTTINGLSWDYDRYGNRWHQNLTAGIGTSTSMSFDTGSNHANTNLAYDVAGSVRNDTSHSYVFDAENRITQVDGGISYIYDAEGRRVGKTDGTVYVVTPTGEILDELKNGQQVRSEIYAAGHHIATYAGNTTYFMHTDWLGTERARTNAGGVLCEIITSQPFGDGTIKSTPPNAPACDPSPDFFTGKQRDIESNLDDFGARYFSSQWGRWMSPDWAASPEAVPYATLANPQSLNLYAYVGNDPINGEDPDGHARYATGTGCGNSDPTCTIDDFDDPGHVQADKQASSSFDWQNVVDFAEGYVQGIAASVTFGAVGAPSQSDSDSSLAGQTAGTIAAGVLGTETTKAGIGTAGVSLAAEAPTAGVSTATLAAGAGVAAAGAAVQAGAAKNASAIAETVAMRNGGGPKEGSTGGPSAGKKPSEAQRQRILKENGGKCVFCGKPNEHVDHAHPRSRGGNTMEENLQGTCAHCNLQKGAKTTGEYQEWLKDRQ